MGVGIGVWTRWGRERNQCSVGLEQIGWSSGVSVLCVGLEHLGGNYEVIMENLVLLILGRNDEWFGMIEGGIF